MWSAGFVYAVGRRSLHGLALALALWGCAARRTVVSAPPDVAAAERHAKRSPRGDADDVSTVHHVVARGQTLWRISRAYQVPLEELARVNGIEDPASLSRGQTVLIPGAPALLDIPPYPAPLSTAAPSMTNLAGNLLGWPLPGGQLLGRFGEARRDHRHAGLDIRGRPGEPVLAADTGDVVFSGPSGGYGQTVILDHGNGLSSLYGHNSSLLVREGERVERGQPIALVGRTGNASTPHCHFEIRRHDVPVDPLAYVMLATEARP